MLHAVHGAALADQGGAFGGTRRDARGTDGVGDTPAAPSSLAALALLEHRVALVSGNGTAAGDVAGWLRTQSGRRPARPCCSRHGPKPLRAGTRRPGRSPRGCNETDMPILLPYTVVEAHLVGCRGRAAGRRPGAGGAALEAALESAEAIGVARPFALSGPCTQEWLASRRRLHATGTFAAQVAAARAAVTSDVAVPLSEREMAVLALLPSLLSAREIAAGVHRLGQHRQEPHPVDLRQAGCLDPTRGGSPRAGARPRCP